MPVRSALLLLGALLCSHASASEPLAPVERPARIRLFGQNGVALTLYTNAHCEDAYEEQIDASGSMSHAFGTLFGKKGRNETLGIPETESTRKLSSRGHLMANPYYLEYPLVPGQPVILRAQIAAAFGPRCQGDVLAAFTPEPGMDYEGDMIRDFDKRICALAIRRVLPDGQVASANGSAAPRTCRAETPPVLPLMALLFQFGSVQYRRAEAGARIQELDDDEDSVKDFEEAIAAAPLLPGMKLCIVSDEDAEDSPLLARLPALLEARGAQVQFIRASAEALQARWQLTEERPLTFPLAEYYCRSAAGY